MSQHHYIQGIETKRTCVWVTGGDWGANWIGDTTDVFGCFSWEGKIQAPKFYVWRTEIMLPQRTGISESTLLF